MKEKERNGVRLGQRVRDLDGNDLGRVKHLYDWGFEVAKGFPILFRREQVARYDEVRGERDGALVLAWSSRDLFDLAAGDVPRSWRIAAPPDFPGVATPSEARAVFEELAAARRAEAAGASSTSTATATATTTPTAASTSDQDREREREATRGQSAGAPPAHP